MPVGVIVDALAVVIGGIVGAVASRPFFYRYR